MKSYYQRVKEQINKATKQAEALGHSLDTWVEGCRYHWTTCKKCGDTVKADGDEYWGSPTKDECEHKA